ncbi:MAG: tryptophan synthase subunit alpha [Pseudomonadales bacterium]|nr:tryptophan synthase subunit alpha [Pseudomonadales bacterium]
MSRLTSTFEALKKKQRTALTTFITAGDPDQEITVPAMHAMVGSGADILELGIPFSDPEADGPAIQSASERALKGGVTLRVVLDMVTEFRASDPDTPVVLMGYLNSIISMGYETFATNASRAGVDGVILVNLPPEEAGELGRLLKNQSIDQIFLVAPTSSTERIKLISAATQGFIYYVTLKGTTGASHLDTSSVKENISRIRAHSDLPIQVGFGIKDGQTARLLRECADGVVVGSALVNLMGDPGSNRQSIIKALKQLTSELREALDSNDSALEN